LFFCRFGFTATDSNSPHLPLGSTNIISHDVTVRIRSVYVPWASPTVRSKKFPPASKKPPSPLYSMYYISPMKTHTFINHMIYIITMPQGEKNKLNHYQRQEIYHLKGKISAYKLAERFNVSHTTIYNIWGKQSPKSCQDALRRIRVALERTRGVEMNHIVYEMWITISAILDDAMEGKTS